MMMSSECALVILLYEIIEVQKGLDWVKNSLDNQYQTSTLKMNMNDKNSTFPYGYLHVPKD